MSIFDTARHFGEAYAAHVTHATPVEIIIVGILTIALIVASIIRLSFAYRYIGITFGPSAFASMIARMSEPRRVGNTARYTFGRGLVLIATYLVAIVSFNLAWFAVTGAHGPHPLIDIARVLIVGSLAFIMASKYGQWSTR